MSGQAPLAQASHDVATDFLRPQGGIAPNSLQPGSSPLDDKDGPERRMADASSLAAFRTMNRRINMDVIKSYSPTTKSNKDIEDDFYSRLSIIQAGPRGNIVVTRHDSNVKIGSINRGYEEIMKKQGLGEMNVRNWRDLSTCTRSLIISGSFFQHKRYMRLPGCPQT